VLPVIGSRVWAVVAFVPTLYARLLDRERAEFGAAILAAYEPLAGELSVADVKDWAWVAAQRAWSQV
jgi:hypothetical protein